MSIIEMGVKHVSTIRELVNLWPTRAELASDICSLSPDLQVTTHQVHKWAEKCSIPSRYHHSVLLAGRRRQFEITAEMIARLHSPIEGASQ